MYCSQLYLTLDTRKLTMPNVNGDMDTLLVLTATGADRPGLVDTLSEHIASSGCEVDESRMSILGSEFAMIMLITGNWSGLAKLESMTPRLEEQLGLRIRIDRTQQRLRNGPFIPYAVEVVTVNRPGVVNEVAHFFAQRKINIEDVFTGTYPAPHTGTKMFSLHLTVAVPGDLSLATLRGEFMDFCDDLNLDAVLAPVK